MGTTVSPAERAPASTATWLAGGAPGATTSPAVLAALCERLLGEGIPLHRVVVFVRTLHPSVLGWALMWHADRGVEWGAAPHQIVDTALFQDSPVRVVFETGTAIRRRLSGGDPLDYPILEDLVEEGATDYLASPVLFTDGEVHCVTWTTRRAGGFTPGHIAALEHLMPAFSRLVETYALRRTARNLLDTYLGPHAGERVLKGAIRRGDSERIDAVIWFSDLRASTRLAEALPAADFMAALNDYYEATAGSVLDHGGQVLRFIGDASLAIFPIGEGTDTAEACRTALAAATEAIARMAGVNGRRREAGEEALGFGVGLHVGTVTYGNIGVPARLEFTVVGAAANEAARIEGLCKAVGRALVVSAAFARALPRDWVSLGAHTLPGIAEPREVFGIDGC